MKRYYNHIVTTSGAGSSSTINGPNARVEPEASPKEVNIEVDLQLEPSSKVVDLLNLPSDPGLRPNIMSYPPNMIEQVRRAYLLKGPCQPRNHDFPQKIEANRKRKFVSAWFDEFKMWLEYSIAKDAAFCLYCYLFSSGSSEKGHDAFISGGFNTWRKKEQDIVNAMRLVNVAKTRLQAMRDKEWEMMLTDISKFCSKNEIEMIDMEDEYAPRGRGRRRVEKMTNLHHYRVELFYTVIDMQALELNQRFDEVNTELILCMSCLDPRDSFAGFDIEKLVQLAKFYPSEFSEVALYELESQLENFIVDVRMDEKFLELSGIGDLAEKMVSTRKHDIFPLVYLLVKLSLTLPVLPATVERAFSAMKIIKSVLRNRMGDNLLNDCLVPYIEKDVFVNVTNEAIMQRFRNMKNGEKCYDF